jgi:hypothetical protein
MPQLDLVTLLDQLVVAYFTFVLLHFLFALGPIPRIFSIFVLRHLLFKYLIARLLARTTTVNLYVCWDFEQEIRFHRLVDSASAE